MRPVDSSGSTMNSETYVEIEDYRVYQKCASMNLDIFEAVRSVSMFDMSSFLNLKYYN